MVSGRFVEQVAFITGAARGQGRSHAVELAREGADIIAVDICRDVDTAPYRGATADDLARTVSEVQALGRRIVAAQADVRDFDSLRTAVDAGVAELGRLDIVSANAGIFSINPLVEVTEDQWTQMVDVNLSGVWRTCKAAIPHLIAGGRGGSIVITSSGAGLRGFANIGHYVAAKHGLIGLMRSLAIEVAPHSIRVNALCPTTVNTDMIHHEAMYRLYAPDLPEPGVEDFEARATTVQSLEIPWVEAIDVTNALMYLASDAGRYITGTALPVDGGSVNK